MIGLVLRQGTQTDHLKSKLQKVWFSNPSGNQMVGIQIPTNTFSYKLKYVAS